MDGMAARLHAAFTPPHENPAQHGRDAREEMPMTPLDKPLKREIEIDGVRYTLVLDPRGLKLAQKGHRRGVELSWKDLVSGDAALATALKASLEAD